jgi:hypothetical protein
LKLLLRLQALKLLSQASRAGMEKARQQLAQADTALTGTKATVELLGAVQAPALFPELFHLHLCSPAPSLRAVSLEQAHAVLKATIECLTEMCALRHMSDFAPVVRLGEHLSVHWDQSLCRGILHNLLHPPGIHNEEELPDWAPSPRKFAQQLNLPVSLMQARATRTLCCLPQDPCLREAATFDSLTCHH